MTVRSQHLKIAGAVGAAALTVGALTTPALAASKDLTYSCATLGPTSTTFDYGTLKPKMVAGQTDKHAMTQVIHLNAGQGALASSLGDHVSGKLTAKGGGNTLAFSMKVPSQALNGGAQDVNASGTGTIRPTKAGTWTVKLGKMSAALVVSGGAGGDTPVTDSCSASTKFGTISVSKDKSKTSVSGSYKAGKTKATVKVKGAKYGLAGTGKVKVFLKKGSKTVASASAKLKNGVAKATMKKSLGKGKYTLSAKFKGDGGLKGSTGKHTVTVK